MQYEIIEDRFLTSTYRVEAINDAGDGEIYVAVFSGPCAKERAEDYAAWMASKEVDLEAWGRAIGQVLPPKPESSDTLTNPCPAE